MSAPLTMPTEAREPQGDDRAERETASAVHPDEVHAGVQAALLPTVDATACAVDVPALQRQRPVRGPSVGSVSGDDSTQRAHASSDACCGSGSPTHAETDCPEVGTGQKSAMDQGKSPTGPACREASAVGAPTVPAPHTGCGPTGTLACAMCGQPSPGITCERCMRYEIARPGVLGAGYLWPILSAHTGARCRQGAQVIDTIS